MRTQTIALPTSGGDMPTYEAVPEGATRGGAVVFQEAFGVNDHIEDVTRRLAAAGWHALAPHLFHRTGSPLIPYGEIENVRGHMQALTGEGLLADLDSCLEHLDAAGLPAARVAVVGFCMGGTVSCFAAARRRLGAAATFYGGGVAESRWPGVPALVELAPELTTPWLGLFGDRDQGIPVADVERLRTVAAGAPVATEVVRYADAGHGFHCDARPANYHEASARDAWGRALEWFDRFVPAT